MKIEKPEIFKEWLTSILGEMCDADPEALGKYILALIKKEKKEKRLEKTLKEKLEDFLLDATGKFVGLVLEKVHALNTNVLSAELSSSANVPPSASSQSNKRILDIREADSFHPKKRQNCDITPHGDTNSRDETFTREGVCVKKEIGDLHTQGSLAQKANAHKDSECPPDPSQQSTQCKDYYEKGYCLRGYFCGFEHGADPVLVDDFPCQFLANLKSSNLGVELTSNKLEGTKSIICVPPLPTSSPPKIPPPPPPLPTYSPLKIPPPPPPLSPPSFTDVFRDHNENKVDGNRTYLQNLKTVSTESKKISQHVESDFKTKKKFDYSRLGTKSIICVPPLPTSSSFTKIPPSPPQSSPLLFTDVFRNHNENKVDGNRTCLQSLKTASMESKKISQHAESDLKTRKKFDYSRLGTPHSSLKITEIPQRLNAEKIVIAYKTRITSHKAKLHQATTQLVKNAIRHQKLILVQLMKAKNKNEKIFLRTALDNISKQIDDLTKSLKKDHKELKSLFLKENTPKMAESKIAVETQPVEVDDDEEEDEEEHREARSWRH